MEKGCWVDYPAENIADQGCGQIEFNVSGTMYEYIDLNDTMLYIKVKITKDDGASLAEGAEIAFASMPLSTLFADVQLSLNNQQVEGGNRTYPYRAYIATLLQHGTGAKREQLFAAGFVKDTAGLFNGSANAAHTTRKAWSAQSASKEFCGPLHLDFFQQSRYLIGGIDIRLRFIRSTNQFAVMQLPTNNAAATAIKVVIEKAVLYMRKVRISPSVINGHEAGLLKHNAIYPIQRCEVISHTVPIGSQCYEKGDLFHGQMPKLVVIGLVSNSAYAGNYTQNPFRFHHFDVTRVSLTREGENAVFKPFEPDFGNAQCIREYMSLFQSMEYYNRDESCDITLADYVGGTTLYAFNLAADLALTGHAQPIREGNLRLDLKFAGNTTVLINIIIWALFDSKIEITRTRNVLLDYKTK
jgi:hypothetical protein